MNPKASKKSKGARGLIQYRYKGLVAGCDEAGRGCLAGPVFAAAVILPKGFKHPILNDSKKLSANARKELRQLIEKEAIAFSVSQVGEKEIDRINILNASIKAMHLAIKKLQMPVDKLIIDGNRFKSYKDIPYECVIKGDGKYYEIAAASILAKEYRDDYMEKIAEEHPWYGWIKNKGYPTKAHRQAILEHGACVYHRKSFSLLPDPEQMKMF